MSSALSYEEDELEPEVLKDPNCFVRRFCQHSIFEVIKSLICVGNFSRMLTYVGELPFVHINQEVLDEFFNLDDFVKAIEGIEEIIMFWFDKALVSESLLQVLEFLDAKVEDEQSEYTLRAIVLRKNNTFNVVVRGMTGINYHRMYSCEKFMSWGEAMFCAVEGDFLPLFAVFVRNNGEEEPEFEFMLERSKESIKKFLELKNCIIKSVHKYAKYHPIIGDVERIKENGKPNKLLALKVLQGLQGNFNSTEE